MRVLVTGAKGFIGRHLVRELLGRDHEVGLNDKRWGMSTADPGWLDHEVTRNAELIVHLGAQCSTAASLRDPAGDFVDNALGTVNVAEASRRAGGVPIVYVSTVKVDPGPDGLVAPLGRSKLVGEEYLRLYHDLYGVRHVTLRPSTVYGPGQDGTADSGWVTWFARAALTGQRIELAGDGSQSRDVLYIDDFVALLVDIVEHFTEYSPPLCSRRYAVGGGVENEVSLNGLLAELGHKDVIYVPTPPGDLHRVVTNNARVSAVRGWAPSVGWRDGLARTMEWLKGEMA